MFESSLESNRFQKETEITFWKDVDEEITTIPQPLLMTDDGIFSKTVRSHQIIAHSDYATIGLILNKFLYF